MTTLTPKQRAYLRKLAHPVRATVQIGKQGLTDAVVASVGQNLLAHELVKVKFVGFKQEKRALAEQLAARTDGQLVTVLGNTAILYRPHPDKDKRQIQL